MESSGTLNLSNELSDAFPVSLAISSPTAIEEISDEEVDSGVLALPLVKSLQSAALKKRTKESSMRQKILTNAAKFEGRNASACRPNLVFKKLTQPSCYGQGVAAKEGETNSTSPVINVPLELDPVVLDPIGGGDIDFEQSQARGIRYGDSGVIAEEENGDTCLAFASNYYVGQASDYVDRSMDLLASMMCAANVSGKKELPEVGETLYLKKSLTTVWDDSNINVEKASVKRLKDSSKGKSRYHTILKLKFRDLDDKERSVLIDLINKPEEKGSSDYNGRMIILESQYVEQEQINIKVGLSIKYKKKGSLLNLSYQKADFGPKFNPKDYLKPDGGLDLVKIKQVEDENQPDMGPPPSLVAQNQNCPPPPENCTGGNCPPPPENCNGGNCPPPPENCPQGGDPNQGDPNQGGQNPPSEGEMMNERDMTPATNIVFAKFSLNVAKGSGDFSYVWTASLGDELSRVFVVNVGKEEDKSLTGCGLAGYGDQLTNITELGKVKGFSCSWAQMAPGHNLTNTPSPYVQKQCFSRADDDKNWTTTLSKVKYSVWKDCGKDSKPDAFDLEPIDSNTGQVSGIVPPESKVEELEVSVSASDMSLDSE